MVIPSRARDLLQYIVPKRSFAEFILSNAKDLRWYGVLVEFPRLRSG
jgi:hypothetical protein